jgi:hypothetical protein
VRREELNAFAREPGPAVRIRGLAESDD